MAAELIELPYPRDRRMLVGHEAAALAVAGAERAGRLHHAWLIGGPEGIGKATLAYRIARFLLARPDERLPGGDGLAVDPAGRTARQVSAGAHPNLVVLERQEGEGEKAASKFIRVEAVRRALDLFATTAADGGRRVCLIDSVEDLNANAANALLKTIEEPPRGAVVLLVSHAPNRVLPTIRSRCRRLTLAPLAAGEVGAVLASLDLDGAAPALLARAAGLAEGSIKRALTLLDPARVALLDEITALLDGLPALPVGRALVLAEKLADRRRAEEFPLALDALQRWLALKVEAGQHLGAARLAPLAEVCENLTDAAREVETYNLDRRAFLMTTFGDLAEAVRRAA